MKSPRDHWIIQIDITSACVHICSNCTRFCGHHKKPFFMDFDTFKRAVDSLEGHVGMIGVMGGEPTLHPEFERFVEYLASQIPEKYRANNHEFAYPQKDFYGARIMSENSQFFIHNYDSGPRNIVCGAGLWSSMNSTYKKHFELIQDSFTYQAVNDHGVVNYHQPILVTRKELGISDEKFKELRDKCWIQQSWSSSITPKGAFFCEIAGALDMLLDGPGGWPIEKDWWKREEKDFGDQLQWCELCAVALNEYTFTRDAREGIDDVSPVWAGKLRKLDSGKMNKGFVNVVAIENGVIAEESKASGRIFTDDILATGFPYADSFESKFSRDKTVLYPAGFECLLIFNSNDSAGEISKRKAETEKYFDRIFEIGNKDRFGSSFNRIIRETDPGKYLIVLAGNISINQNGFEELKKCIINTGTLHFTNFSENYSCCDKFFADSQSAQGYAALLHKNALSLRRIGFDRIAAMDDFLCLVGMWDSSKKVSFVNEMLYEPKPLPPRFQNNPSKLTSYKTRVFTYYRQYGLIRTTLRICSKVIQKCLGGNKNGK